MNDLSNTPVRAPDPFENNEIGASPFGPGSRPSGRTGCAVSSVPASIPDAHQSRANEAAARIAAREVHAHWLRTGSAEHLASYEAWVAGERAWPWPDPTPDELAIADAAVREIVVGHKAFERNKL